MTKNDDPLFNVTLVRAVRKYPCIWNYNLPEYSKRPVTEKAWAEIGLEVKDTGQNCRERWRNIRGAFIRSLKNPQNSTKKKYYLNEYLQFLRPYAFSKTLSVLEAVAENDDLSEDITIKSEEFHSELENEDFEGCSSPRDIVEENIQRRDTLDEPMTVAKKRKFTQASVMASNSSDDNFVDWFTTKEEQSDPNDDPNLLFLRSLLPDMKQMTDKQNRRFRQKVIGLMDDILADADIS